MQIGTNNMPPVPERPIPEFGIPVPEGGVEEDPEAVSESRLTDSGDYDKEERRDDYLRRRDLQNALSSTGRVALWVAQGGIVVLGICLVGVGVVFVVQYALPVDQVWFPPDRIEKIESFITGSGLAAISFLLREYRQSRK